MQLETVSKIKGWCALGMIAPLFLLFLFAPLHLAQGWMIEGALALFPIGIIIGISWVRQRKRMRTLDYAARQFKKGGD